MSKKGRASIVLLGSLVLALICAPLVFLAYGAKLDRDALNNRIADLEATEVASPTALQADYRSVVEGYLQILPPDSDFRCSTSRDIVVFDPAHFEGWQEALEPAELDGVTVYPVTVAEDPETRYTVFYNASDELVATLAPEQDYNPFAWLELLYPEYYAQNADPAELAWAEAQYDPARMSVTYYLLSVDDVEAMAEAQLAANEQRGFEMSMMMGEELPEPVTNLVLFAIEAVTNGVALGIGWPDDFTNNLEVLARDTIAKVGWSVISSNLSTAGTNSLWWVDTTVNSNSTLRFYLLGDAQADSDGDGLTDAREIRCYGTSITNCDSDADGLRDEEELCEYFTDPLVSDSDQDGLSDAEEVRGSAAWAIAITNTIQWVEPGTNSQWVTQWTTGRFDNGRVSLALSDPIPAAIKLGTNQFSSLRVSSDGYILLGEAAPLDIVTYGVNLPLKWPGLTNLVAVFWDELNVSSNTGIWVETNGTGSESRVTITWLNARVPGPQGSEGCDFQMSYTASNSAYTFQYRESSGLLFPTQTLCTVGIRGDDSNRMARVFFNRYGVLHPSMSISLTPACSDPNNTNSDNEFGLDSEDAAKGMHPALQDDWGSDVDGDGLPLWDEMEYGADAFDVDTDGDGMLDGDEAACYLNPASPLDFWWDADGDGLCNGDEFRYGADPLQVDTDNDGVLDLAEVNQATDPADPGSYESDGAYGIILNMTGAAGKSVGGTCFQVGSYRVRAGEGIALPYAQRTEVKLMTMEGYVQCPRVNTDAWNGYYQYTLPSGDWFMGDVLVERPWNVFGENKVIPVSGEEISIFGGLKAKITAPGGGELQKNWCIGSTVEMQGAINLEGAAGGTWTWSVNDNTNDPSLTANGSNATLAIGGQVTVKASYKLPGYPVEASEVLTVHENTVTFTLAPFIGVNDNDSDANGTNDCEQAQPLAGDPEITTATVSYHKTCSCSQIIKPVIVVSLASGADKVRVWKMNNDLCQFPLINSNYAASLSFKVEGTNASSALNDVQFTARVNDHDYPSVVVSNAAAVTVMKVDIEQVISDQLPGVEANTLPVGDGTAGSTDPNNPMIMGNRSDDKAYLQIGASVAPLASASVVFVGVRKQGTTAILNSHAVVSSGIMPLSFSPVPRGLYEVVAGIDTDGSGTLSDSEVCPGFAFLQRVLTITQADYDGDMDSLSPPSGWVWLAAVGMAANYLHEFRTAGTAGALLPGATRTFFWQDPLAGPDHPTHPLGQAWSSTSPYLGICPLDTFPTSSDFSAEFRDSALVNNRIWDEITTPEHRAEVQAAFATYPPPGSEVFTWNWTLNATSAFDWLPNNPGIFGAIGAVTITGTVSVTVRESDLGITTLHFEGSLDDLYDGNYKKPGNQEITTVEAGYPTLGQGGRTFKTHLGFEGTITNLNYSYR